MRTEYDYKIIRMSSNKFDESDIKLILDQMKKDGWVLYDKSEEKYFFIKKRHC